MANHTDISTRAGKGSRLHRNVSNPQFRKGWDRIFGAPRKRYPNPPKTIREAWAILDMIDDQPVTPMPTRCLSFLCEQSGNNKLIRNRDGFMVCPNCHGSYGRGTGV